MIIEASPRAAPPPPRSELLAWAAALEERGQLGAEPDFDLLLALRGAIRQLSDDRSADEARVRIDALAQRELDRVQRRRNLIHQELSTSFPSHDVELLPMRLGNVIRAAEP